ncbi:unnamed protein product [Polarella glacialis]|uniref:Phospholipase B-like n=1 Tax=Polarella glacialis TaxID=89957 RepID=A0A813EJ67_POLGL|nr:unnamed protein product [Polarella glacialis]
MACSIPLAQWLLVAIAFQVLMRPGQSAVVVDRPGPEDADAESCLLQKPMQQHALTQADETGPRAARLQLASAEQEFERLSRWPEACNSPFGPPGPNATQKSAYCAIARETGNVYSGIINSPSSEKNMRPSDRYRFEHQVAISLTKTTVQDQTTKEFARRLHNLIVAGGWLNGVAAPEALTNAFGPKCSLQWQGFVNNKSSTIETVLLKNGNIREIWGLANCLINNLPVLEDIFMKANASFFEGALGAAAGARAFAVVQERKAQVLATASMPGNVKYTFGIPDFLWPTKNSWANFGYGASLPQEVGGGVLWVGARNYTGCTETDLMTDSPDIFPPLSHREIEAQCEGNAPPCKLQWLCANYFNIVADSFYAERATRNGYRMVAGPSGTTANMFQLALSLGFTNDDLLAFRVVMTAWLVQLNDHSLIETILAAEAQMPSEYSMQWGRKSSDHDKWPDFQRIWPKGTTLQTSWGPVFESFDFLP